MSEHELWNELGNLYFLSGSYDQAVHAYNKAIQLESGFGKPYSNLALIYTKQARYEDAIHLYKRSLELLTDTNEQAVTWNRLGNAYRQIKEYQEAVFAYQCADNLKSSITKDCEQPDHMLYVSSESEALQYEVVEEPLDYQNQPVDYVQDTEPEFDEELPELVPVEIAMLVNKNLATPIVNLPVDGADKPMQVLHETESADIQTPILDAATPQFEAMETLEDAEEQVFLEENPVEDTAQTSNDEMDEMASTLLKADVQPGVESPETVISLDEPIAQADDDVEVLSDELMLSLSEADSGSEQGAAETKPALTEPVALINDEPEEMGEIDSISTSITLSLDTDGDEAAQEAKREIGKEEEEKLTKQIEINPRSATTWESLGTLYKTAGRYEEAIQAFKQAISIAPREVSCYHNLGLVYAAQGSNEDAFNAFQKVLELDPNHSLTHASLGGYYKKLGLDELAQKHIGKAMKNIYESENEYNRACLDAICGNVDQAIELLQVALENKQTYVDWVLNDPDLDALHQDERFKQLISEFSK